MRREHTTKNGFAMILVVLLLVILSSLAVGLCLSVESHGRAMTELEAQLYSLVLAENGVEYIRTVLPSLDIQVLLRGPDGLCQGSETPGWRNPLSFQLARTVDLTRWQPAADDGIARIPGVAVSNGVFACEGGSFVTKVSNDPTEPPGDDEDGVVLVRSMGIVPRDAGGTVNCSSLVEAVLRQERAFEVPSPLTLMGNDADLQWNGSECRIEGQGAPAIAVLSSGSLLSRVTTLLNGTTPEQVTGGGLRPSVRDLTSFLASQRRRCLTEPRFWVHLYTQLPRFGDEPQTGLMLLPNGGQLNDSFRGIILCRGDLRVAGNLHGLLVHLGNGGLTLEGNSRIQGGVWMSNVASESSSSLIHQALQFRMAGAAALVFDPSAVSEALEWLPPTQLGWRILFPEMAH